MTDLPKNDEVTNNEESKPESVDLSVYNNVKNDMMKYKQEKNELKQRLAELEAQAEQQRLREMEKNQEWEKIAKLKDSQLQELTNKQREAQEKMVNSHKKAAVIEQLGGFIKPQYADMAINLENIAMVDGIIDESTLLAECERIRREDGALLKSSKKSSLPSQAPSPSAEMDTKNYNNLSPSEREQLKRKMILDRIKSGK